MSRVHTILSILAEDHAPVALRPSILLAIDWPTVAEEAPATGDDSYLACVASGILGGNARHADPPAASVATMAVLATRLATVAASLTVTGDKAMAHHAAALWGAAGALVGLRKASETPNPAGWDDFINGISSLTRVRPLASRADEMLDIIMRWHGAHHALRALTAKASDIVPGAIAVGIGEQANLIATAIDRVHGLQRECDTITAQRNGASDVAARRLAIIMQHDEQDLRLRDILGAEASETTENAAKRVITTRNVAMASSAISSDKVREAQAELASVREALCAWSGETTVHAAERIADGLNTKSKELYDAHAERDALRAQVDRMIAAMREDAPAPVKPRPQPGDEVPWAEVEDGCLYFDPADQAFLLVYEGVKSWLWRGGQDIVADFLRDKDGWTETPMSNAPKAVLVARDLGTDPEAWRKAMREWTAKGGK